MKGWKAVDPQHPGTVPGLTDKVYARFVGLPHCVVSYLTFTCLPSPLLPQVLSSMRQLDSEAINYDLALAALAWILGVCVPVCVGGG